jgi:hypothetical protein
LRGPCHAGCGQERQKIDASLYRDSTEEMTRPSREPCGVTHPVVPTLASSSCEIFSQITIACPLLGDRSAAQS